MPTAGFVAFAPDLYRGLLAGHTEMDKAGELMNAMPPDRAARDMSGAVDLLAADEAVTSDGLGVVGFCMGGLLTFVLAALRPDKIKAAVPFYGYPYGDQQPDYSQISAAIQGHMAENDSFFGPEGAKDLERRLQRARQGRHDHRPPRHGPRVHGPAQRARHPRPGGVRPDLAAGARLPARAPRLTGSADTLCVPTLSSS